MSLFVTVTRFIRDGKVAVEDRSVFDAPSAQQAAEMHQEVTSADEVLVFPVENGRLFRKATMVEVPPLAKARALDLQYASQLAACKDPFVR